MARSAIPDLAPNGRGNRLRVTERNTGCKTSDELRAVIIESIIMEDSAEDGATTLEALRARVAELLREKGWTQQQHGRWGQERQALLDEHRQLSALVDQSDRRFGMRKSGAFY